MSKKCETKKCESKKSELKRWVKKIWGLIMLIKKIVRIKDVIVKKKTFE